MRNLDALWSMLLEDLKAVRRVAGERSSAVGGSSNRKDTQTNHDEDETRPVCNRCTRCGFDCDGAKDMAFIKGTIVKSRRSVKRMSTPTTVCHKVMSPLKESLSMKNLEFEVFVCYARRHLSRGRAIDLALQKQSLSTIIEAGLSTESSFDQIFPQALLSFAVIVFGADHYQKPIADKGYLFLGGTFQRLNQALLDPNCYARDEVILSVATIAILECLVPTGTDNYLKHMLGLEKLLELRDPSKFSSCESIDLYKSIRHMLLFATLRTGRPSILAKPEWKAVLRQYCSEDELQEQNLLDILADCTVLNSELKKFSSESDINSSQVTKERDDVEQRALALLASLHQWKVVRSIVETNNVKVIQDDLRPDAGGTYEFTNEAAALLHMLHNTTLICVLSILVSIPRPSHSSNGKSQQADRRRAAVEICRCVPYYIQVQNSKKHPHGSPIAHWAMATAWQLLSNDTSPEEKRMVELLSMKGKGITAKAIWRS